MPPGYFTELRQVAPGETLSSAAFGLNSEDFFYLAVIPPALQRILARPFARR